MVTHWAHNPKIAGSIPAPATESLFEIKHNYNKDYA